MRFFGVILIAFFLAGVWGEAGAVMSGGPRVSPPVKGDGIQKEPELKKSPAPANSVRRVADLIKKIEGGILYTETGRYSLAGVQVLDLTKNLKAAGREGMVPKIAEMTFINGQLKEVVIRQR